MTIGQLKILVVDDHALLRHVIKSALAANDIELFDSADNGRDALEKIQQAQQKKSLYDVVFLDWNMPEVNGFEVLKACRKDPSMNKMAIVMVTAEAEPESIVKALDAGATAYITKPFNTDALLEKLKALEVWKTKMSSKAT